MKNITSTEKIGVIAIILNVVIFLFCFFLFRDIQKRSIATSTIVNELSKASENQSQYLSVGDIIKETNQDRATIDSFFIGKEGTVGFIEFIEEQARVSSVSATINSVSSKSNEVASSTVEVLQLAVETEGKWANLYHFFSLLKNVPYSIRLVNVVIKETDTKAKVWQADFSLEALKLKK